MSRVFLDDFISRTSIEHFLFYLQSFANINYDLSKTLVMGCSKRLIHTANADFVFFFQFIIHRKTSFNLMSDRILTRYHPDGVCFRPTRPRVARNFVSRHFGFDFIGTCKCWLLNTDLVEVSTVLRRHSKPKCTYNA